VRDRSEFQTEGTVTLKPWETKVVQPWGTDNRLVLEDMQQLVAQKRAAHT